MPNHRREERVPSGDDAAVAAWLGRLQDASFGRASQATRTAYPPNRRMTGTQLAGYLARRTYALASTTRPGGRPHAAPTLFSLYADSLWLPTVAGAALLGNVEAHPWLALSIIEGEHDSHAAVLTEGPAEVLATVPDKVRNITQLRNRGGSMELGHGLDTAQPTAAVQLRRGRLAGCIRVADESVDRVTNRRRAVQPSPPSTPDRRLLGLCPMVRSFVDAELGAVASDINDASASSPGRKRVIPGGVTHALIGTIGQRYERAVGESCGIFSWQRFDPAHTVRGRGTPQPKQSGPGRKAMRWRST
jgi:hypothetical protein